MDSDGSGLPIRNTNYTNKSRRRNENRTEDAENTTPITPVSSYNSKQFMSNSLDQIITDIDDDEDDNSTQLLNSGVGSPLIYFDSLQEEQQSPSLTATREKDKIRNNNFGHHESISNFSNSRSASSSTADNSSTTTTGQQRFKSSKSSNTSDTINISSPVATMQVLRQPEQLHQHHQQQQQVVLLNPSPPASKVSSTSKTPLISNSHQQQQKEQHEQHTNQNHINKFYDSDNCDSVLYLQSSSMDTIQGGASSYGSNNEGAGQLRSRLFKKAPPKDLNSASDNHAVTSGTSDRAASRDRLSSWDSIDSLAKPTNNTSSRIMPPRLPSPPRTHNENRANHTTKQQQHHHHHQNSWDSIDSLATGVSSTSSISGIGNSGGMRNFGAGMNDGLPPLRGINLPQQPQPQQRSSNSQLQQEQQQAHRQTNLQQKPNQNYMLHQTNLTRGRLPSVEEVSFAGSNSTNTASTVCTPSVNSTLNSPQGSSKSNDSTSAASTNSSQMTALTMLANTDDDTNNNIDVSSAAPYSQSNESRHNTNTTNSSKVRTLNSSCGNSGDSNSTSNKDAAAAAYLALSGGSMNMNNLNTNSTGRKSQKYQQQQSQQQQQLQQRQQQVPQRSFPPTHPPTPPSSSSVLPYHERRKQREQQKHTTTSTATTATDINNSPIISTSLSSSPGHHKRTKQRSNPDMNRKQHKKNSSSVTFANLLVQRSSSNEQIISNDSIDAASSPSPQQSQKSVLKRPSALRKTDRARTVEVPNRNNMGSINALHAGNRKRAGSLETMQQISTPSTSSAVTTSPDAAPPTKHYRKPSGPLFPWQVQHQRQKSTNTLSSSPRNSPRNSTPPDEQYGTKSSYSSMSFSSNSVSNSNKNANDAKGSSNSLSDRLDSDVAEFLNSEKKQNQQTQQQPSSHRKTPSGNVILDWFAGISSSSPKSSSPSSSKKSFLMEKSNNSNDITTSLEDKRRDYHDRNQAFLKRQKSIDYDVDTSNTTASVVSKSVQSLTTIGDPIRDAISVISPRNSVNSGRNKKNSVPPVSHRSHRAGLASIDNDNWESDGPLGGKDSSSSADDDNGNGNATKSAHLSAGEIPSSSVNKTDFTLIVDQQSDGEDKVGDDFSPLPSPGDDSPTSALIKLTNSNSSNDYSAATSSTNRSTNSLNISRNSSNLRGDYSWSLSSADTKNLVNQMDEDKNKVQEHLTQQPQYFQFSPDHYESKQPHNNQHVHHYQNNQLPQQQFDQNNNYHQQQMQQYHIQKAMQYQGNKHLPDVQVRKDSLIERAMEQEQNIINRSGASKNRSTRRRIDSVDISIGVSSSSSSEDGEGGNDKNNFNNIITRDASFDRDNDGFNNMMCSQDSIFSGGSFSSYEANNELTSLLAQNSGGSKHTLYNSTNIPPHQPQQQQGSNHIPPNQHQQHNYSNYSAYPYNIPHNNGYQYHAETTSSHNNDVHGDSGGGAPTPPGISTQESSSNKATRYHDNHVNHRRGHKSGKRQSKKAAKKAKRRKYEKKKRRKREKKAAQHYRKNNRDRGMRQDYRPRQTSEDLSMSDSSYSSSTSYYSSTDPSSSSSDSSSEDDIKTLKRAKKLEKEYAALVAKWRAEARADIEQERREEEERRWYNHFFRYIKNLIRGYSDSAYKVLSTTETYICNLPLTINAVALALVTMGCVWFKFMEENVNVCLPAHFRSPECTFPEFPGCFECDTHNPFYRTVVTFHYCCSTIAGCLALTFLAKVALAWRVVIDELNSPTTSSPAGLICMTMVTVFAGRGILGQALVCVAALFHFFLVFWFMYMALAYRIKPDPSWYPNTVGIGVSAVKIWLYYPNLGHFLMMISITLNFLFFPISLIRVTINKKISAPVCWIQMSSPSISLYALTIMAQPDTNYQTPGEKTQFQHLHHMLYLPLMHVMFTLSVMGCMSSIQSLYMRWKTFSKKSFCPAHAAFCFPTLAHANAIQAYRGAVDSFSTIPVGSHFKIALDTYWILVIVLGTITTFIITFKFFCHLPVWVQVDITEEEEPPPPDQTLMCDVIDVGETFKQDFVNPAVLQANETGALVRVRRGTEDWRGPYVRTRKVAALGFEPTMNSAELNFEREALLDYVSMNPARIRNRTLSVPGIDFHQGSRRQGGTGFGDPEQGMGGGSGRRRAVTSVVSSNRSNRSIYY